MGHKLRSNHLVTMGHVSSCSLGPRLVVCSCQHEPRYILTHSFLNHSGHILPQPYRGSTYEILRTGTKNNGTHWQVTAKCSGCTSYGSSSSSSSLMNRLSATGSNRLAFAYSSSKPSNPSSNMSDFSEHSVIGFWNHDFSSAVNPTFTSLVAKNKGSR